MDRQMTELTLDLAPLSPSDLPQIEKLDERAFGPGRFTRTAYRLREGVPPLASISFVARVGTFLVGANIMTEIRCGGAPALLLGPLTVEPAFRSRGIGEELVARSLAAAREAGHKLVLLVGDEPYYQRMGFKRVPSGQVTMPGPVDPARVLVCELAEGAFANVRGPVTRAR
jgi:predicted N-acetyltransferase YhbS